MGDQIPLFVLTASRRSVLGTDLAQGAERVWQPWVLAGGRRPGGASV